MTEMTNPKAEAMAERIAAVLRGALAERQISRRRLAELLGAPANTVTSWVAGRRLIPLWRIPEIEDVLGVRRGYLLRRAGLVEAFDTATVTIETTGVEHVVINGAEAPQSRRPVTLLRQVAQPVTNLHPTTSGSPEGGVA